MNVDIVGSRHNGPQLSTHDDDDDDDDAVSIGFDIAKKNSGFGANFDNCNNTT